MTPTISSAYWANGWAVVDDVFSGSEIDAIVRVTMEESQRGLENFEEDFPAELSPEGETAPRKINRAYLKHPAFKAFVMDQRLTQILAELLGAPPLLTTDQIFMKPPHFGSAKPYHQDNYYFQCQPADRVITAWVALDDADGENGCLRYIDGSHRGGMLPHDKVPRVHHTFVPPPELVDLSKESLALVRKGGVVVHHCMTLHTSHRNDSDRWRRGYASHWVTSDVTSTSETIDQAYFNMDCQESSGGADESFCNYMVV